VAIRTLPRLRLPPARILLEARAAPELLSAGVAWPFLRLSAPTGDGHPVLVLPGWLAGDGSTLVLRRLLRQLGYFAHGWRLGRNRGPNTETVRGLERRLLALAQRHGRPVSIVGWSLGGVFARELARLRPAAVRQVIALASPLRARFADEIAATFERTLERRAVANAGVPLTAILSRSDAIVAWRSCLAEPGPTSESFEVPSSHLGIGHHPAALWLIAGRLARPVEPWSPLEVDGLAARVLGVRAASSEP
jgi:pimeloyl-ACP methyl ester carboxylesterase